MKLKHLTPYADKAVYGMFNGKKDIVTAIDFDFKTVSSMNNGSVEVCNLKLILKPLSELKEIIPEINSELGTLDGRYKIIKGMLCFVQNNKMVLTSSNVDTMPYNVVKILLENHFDIFNLIPQKLAINELTLKQ